MRDHCPACGSATGFGRVRCFKCGHERAHREPVSRAAIDERRQRGIAAARRVWHEASHVQAGDPVARYLEGRGLPVRVVLDEPSPVRGELRFHPALRHPTGHVGPAMVAAVRGVSDQIVALSRLWLTEDGHKADVSPSRAFLGSTRGAAFKTAGTSWRGRMVVLVEGVEDALAMLALEPRGWPWACLSAGGLETVEVPRGVDVMIAADLDPVGIASARRAAQRLQGLGQRVEIVLPDQGKDPNARLVFEPEPEPEPVDDYAFERELRLAAVARLRGEHAGA